METLINMSLGHMLVAAMKIGLAASVALVITDIVRSIIATLLDLIGIEEDE